MARSKNLVASRLRKKTKLKLAKGFRGSRHRLYRIAAQTVEKGWGYAYRDRKNKKRTFRRLWITRINAACRNNGISYSKFINALHRADISVNRKVLANLAWHDQEAFAKLVDIAKENMEV